MDIIIKTVFNEIINCKEHSYAILAGGAVRNTYFGKKPKDYDICVPVQNTQECEQLIQHLAYSLPIEDIVNKSKDTSEYNLVNDRDLIRVYGFTFEGNKFDLLCFKRENNEEFAEKVVSEFDYGINMIYDTGDDIIETKEFTNDLNNGTITLYSISEIDELPKAIERFNYLNETLGGYWKFRCPKISILGDSETKEQKMKSKYSLKTVYSPIDLEQALTGGITINETF